MRVLVASLVSLGLAFIPTPSSAYGWNRVCGDDEHKFCCQLRADGHYKQAEEYCNTNNCDYEECGWQSGWSWGGGGRPTKHPTRTSNTWGWGSSWGNTNSNWQVNGWGGSTPKPTKHPTSWSWGGDNHGPTDWTWNGWGSDTWTNDEWSGNGWNWDGGKPTNQPTNKPTSPPSAPPSPSPTSPPSAPPTPPPTTASPTPSPTTAPTTVSPTPSPTTPTTVSPTTASPTTASPTPSPTDPPTETPTLLGESLMPSTSSTPSTSSNPSSSSSSSPSASSMPSTSSPTTPAPVMDNTPAPVMDNTPAPVMDNTPAPFEEPPTPCGESPFKGNWCYSSGECDTTLSIQTFIELPDIGDAIGTGISQQIGGESVNFDVFLLGIDSCETILITMEGELCIGKTAFVFFYVSEEIVAYDYNDGVEYVFSRCAPPPPRIESPFAGNWCGSVSDCEINFTFQDYIEPYDVSTFIGTAYESSSNDLFEVNLVSYDSEAAIVVQGGSCITEYFSAGLRLEYQSSPEMVVAAALDGGSTYDLLRCDPPPRFVSPFAGCWCGFDPEYQINYLFQDYIEPSDQGVQIGGGDLIAEAEVRPFLVILDDIISFESIKITMSDDEGGGFINAEALLNYQSSPDFKVVAVVDGTSYDLISCC